MSDKDTYHGVWIAARLECIRAAFAKFYERDPQAAIEHANDRLAWASRLEETRARLRTTI